MRAPAFWWRAEPSLAARALGPLGAIVGAVAAQRMARGRALRLGVPVLCVGNPTVGGAGKTPVAITIANALRAVGAAPVFLTRGYGGALGGPVVVAGHGAAEVGDEALLLAAVAPTVVSRDRAAGGRLAERLGDVLVMDDGFQNPALAKTWSALLIDAAAGIGNGAVTPAGPLRAPLARQLPFADAVVVVDGSEPGKPALPSFGSVPVRRARLIPIAPDPLAGPLVAFAGIGRPQKFFASVAALGGHVVAARAFPDHHRFTDGDAETLLSEAARRGARLVTTRKDVVRLQGRPVLEALAAASLVVEIEAVLDDRLRDDVVAAYRTAR